MTKAAADTDNVTMDNTHNNANHMKWKPTTSGNDAIIDDNAMTNNATDDADEMGINRIISKFLDADGIQRYQSLIGSFQCVVSLGRFDIATAVLTLSIFCSIPRHRHLERARRVAGYLFSLTLKEQRELLGI